MDQIIEALATGIGNLVGWAATSGILFALFALIWVGLGAAYVSRHESIDDVWRTIRRLNIVVQLLMWLLLLPVMLGLWIWERVGWPIVVRAILVLGIAGWNLIVFLPSSPA